MVKMEVPCRKPCISRSDRMGFLHSQLPWSRSAPREGRRPRASRKPTPWRGEPRVGVKGLKGETFYGFQDSRKAEMDWLDCWIVGCFIAMGLRNLAFTGSCWCLLLLAQCLDDFGGVNVKIVDVDLEFGRAEPRHCPSEMSGVVPDSDSQPN